MASPTMLSAFLTFVNSQALFNPNDRVLLAVSGGMDSVVMSELFHLAQFNFEIAHCNFGLRGEESDADEIFVKKLAKKYKVNFYTETFDTQAFAEHEGVSIQMAARLLRYRWFEQLMADQGFDYLATAHHQNDILETILLNLTKGTGIAGLHGIRHKNGKIIRPIAFADKEMIHDLLVQRQLTWREDSSNESNKYQRNLIRNEIVPLLKQINPNLEQTIHQTAEKVSAVEKIFEAEIEQLRAQVLQDDKEVYYLNFEPLLASLEPQIKLYELIRPFHFTYLQAKEIWDALPKEAGKTFFSPTHTLVKDRMALVITPKSIASFVSATIEEGQTSFKAEGLELKLSLQSKEGFKIPHSSSICCLDFNSLQFPLKLRKWKEGDWFCPLGMNQKKKISDFLIDEKVPLNLKPQTLVLTSNGSIVWIVGRRVDNRFKVTDKTERILIVEKL